MWVLVITKIRFFSSQGTCAPFGEVRIVNLREFSSENGRLSLQILENFELNILCCVLSSMYYVYGNEESKNQFLKMCCDWSRRSHICLLYWLHNKTLCARRQSPKIRPEKIGPNRPDRIIASSWLYRSDCFELEKKVKMRIDIIPSWKTSYKD